MFRILIKSRPALALLLAWFAVQGRAALLEVTHTPIAGQYASVTAALAVATNNDIIEVIDNSAPFIGQVIVDGSTLSKNNLTIRGKSGLNPRPTLRGNATGNPFDTGLKVAFSYNNAVDNLQVSNLIIEAGAGDDVAVDARFWNGATFTNVQLVGGGANAFRSQVASTLNSCTLTGSNNTIEQFFGGPLILDNCTVSGGLSNGVNISGGTVTFRNHTTVSSQAATSLFIHGEFAGNNPNVTLQDSILTHSGGGGNNLMVINSGGAGAAATTLTIDNSDLIGDVTGYPANSGTGAGIILNTTLAALNVKDTIFFNISSVAYALNGNTANIAGFEDYNAYKKAPNNLQDQGLTRGTHNVYLTNTFDSTGYLYAFEDPSGTAGDYRLLSLSPAATLNSTGTPVYAGSLGIHPSLVPVELSGFELM